MSHHNSFTHHVPLFLFTCLMIFAAGVTLGSSADHLFHWGYFLPGWVGIAVAVLSFFGLMASFMHLGRKERAFRTAAGIFRSWLSIEAALAGSFTGVVVLAAINPPVPGIWMLPWAAAGLAILLPISIGMLYRLIAQKGWDKPCLILQPILMVLLLASALLSHNTVEGSYPVLFFVFAGVDLLFSVGSFLTRKESSSKDFHLEFPDLKKTLIPLASIRWVATAAALVFALSGNFYLCIPCYGVALVIDRFLFYAFALKQTTGNDLAQLKEERMRQAL